MERPKTDVRHMVGEPVLNDNESYSTPQEAVSAPGSDGVVLGATTAANTPVRPEPLVFGSILLGLCLAVFLVGVDQTILATAVPTISDDFHAIDDIGWWSAAYLLSMSTLQLFYGKLYSLFSVKAVFLCAIALFEIGSIVCAAAPNSSALIVGRAIAGAGGAGVFSGSILVLSLTTPLDKRAAYTGILAATFGVAAVVGPFLGGALTDHSTWRWCFGINPPIGLVTLVVIGVFLKTPPKADSKTRSTAKETFVQLDPLGTVTMIATVLCLLLALQWGGVIYGWNDARIIALLVLSAVFFLMFILSQHLAITHKTIPTSVSKNLYVWSAGLFAVCVSGAIYVAVIYLPVWFQGVLNASALRSGVMLTPLIVGYVLCSVIGGIVTSGIGYYMPVMIASAILASVGSGLMTTFTPSVTTSMWIGYQVLYGFGVGFGLQAPLLVVQTVLEPSNVPIGVALITLMQTLGGAVFVAVAQSIFQNDLRDGLEALDPMLTEAIFDRVGATDIASLFRPDQRSIVNHIYTSAIVKMLYIILILSCVSLVGALGSGWKSMKSKQESKEEEEPRQYSADARQDDLEEVKGE